MIFMIKKTLSFSIGFSLFLFLLSLIPLDFYGFQLRKYEYIKFFDGPIQSSFLALTSIFVALYLLYSKRIKLSILFIISTIAWLGIAKLFYSIEIGPTVKKDYIIYYNELNPAKKLILQPYETGITGNGRWQGIITNDLKSDIRKIQNLKVNKLTTTFNLSEFDAKMDEVIKSYNYKGENYILESIDKKIYNETEIIEW